MPIVDSAWAYTIEKRAAVDFQSPRENISAPILFCIEKSGRAKVTEKSDILDLLLGLKSATGLESNRCESDNIFRGADNGKRSWKPLAPRSSGQVQSLTPDLIYGCTDAKFEFKRSEQSIKPDKLFWPFFYNLLNVLRSYWPMGRPIRRGKDLAGLIDAGLDCDTYSVPANADLGLYFVKVVWRRTKMVKQYRKRRCRPTDCGCEFCLK